MRPELLVPAALVIDSLLGDPRGFPHPTRAMGALAARLERKLRPEPTFRDARNRNRELAAGTLGWLLVVGAAAAFGWGLIEAAAIAARILAGLAGADQAAWSKTGSGIASVYLVYASIAPRDLAAHALRVYRALAGEAKNGESLAKGRLAVSMIVGRDVERLDEAGVIKATVESVAESAIDGVCAPLFWALALGPLGAIAYRAANTLDSMWGHKSERYLYFGRIAARADDLLTWPAARLGFAASVAATALAAVFRPGRFSPRRALSVGIRDRRRHESPNSAWLEASFAGALGVELAGPAWYGGILHEKPTIGDATKAIAREDIPRSVALMYATTLLFAAAGIALAHILN